MLEDAWLKGIAGPLSGAGIEGMPGGATGARHPPIPKHERANPSRRMWITQARIGEGLEPGSTTQRLPPPKFARLLNRDLGRTARAPRQKQHRSPLSTIPPTMRSGGRRGY